MEIGKGGVKEAIELKEKLSQIKRDEKRKLIETELVVNLAKSSDKNKKILKKFTYELAEIANPNSILTIDGLKRTLEIIEKIRKMDFPFPFLEQSCLQTSIYMIYVIHRTAILELNEAYQEILNKYEISEKDLNKLNRRLKKYIPKSRSENDLIKHYFNILLKKKKIPTYDLLASEIYEKTSWSYKMKDELFIVKLIKMNEKKLNRKNLTQETKNLLIENKLYLEQLCFKCHKKEKQKTGIKYKNKQDYNDKLGDEISEIFNSQ